MEMEMEDFSMWKEKERCVLVGLQMDANGRELLDWAISKVAEKGDRVVAVHVCRESDLKTTTTLSLIRVLDEYLAAYDDFCNLKQVALVGRVSRGNSIRKVLVKEAKLCDAMKVVVGINKHCSLGGSALVAKYCAKKLSPITAVIAMQNGRVIFERVAAKPSPGAEPKPISQSTSHPSLSMNQELKSPCCKKKTEIRTPRLLNAGFADDRKEETKDSGSITNSDASSISGLAQKLAEPRLGWPLLGKGGTKYVEVSNTRKMSVIQWVMNLPNRSLSFKLQKDLTEELKSIISDNNPNFRWFTYEELCSLTNQFCADNVIGKGGSSEVYRGCLPNGKHVAIKLSKLSEEASRDFLLEVKIITKLDHKLIVPLIGICIEYNTLISVYNYFPTGNLEENLHGKNVNSPIPWHMRFKVAIGVAEALKYLHSGCSNPVIHRDVKSSNILLTDEFEPQISDFGLAIWAPTTSTYLTHDDVVGTFGYLAPEYFMHGKVSNKIDVFAFGVVLLELLTGRKPISDENPKGQESLVMWATPILERGEFMDLLDPNLNDNYDEEQMRKVALAASLCIARTAHLRPQMVEILSLLQGEEDIDTWMSCHVDASLNGLDCQEDEACPSSSIRSHIGLALQDVEDDASLSSFDQSNFGSLEEYLRERWSRSSSFD
ncbi:putative receptor-like serine/threonine-protein kinase [Canna indica]|uniref:Receptor-like serine/threonine-protein kinase n=1 Tax=Canna indica TaxID=4628 RepID=A0AAQ3KEM2_9LILI|nr:putative receptor-like serine/threonine-protein kinase [Canna indica]